MLKLRNAVLTALLAFCLAMPFVSCSFNDGATGDVSGDVKVQSDNNQNGGNENPSGGNNGGNGHEHPSGGDSGDVEVTEYTVKYRGEVLDTISAEKFSAYSSLLTKDTDYTISGNVITLTDSGFKKVMAAGAGEDGDDSGTEYPGTEYPGTDEPGTDYPGTEYPVTDEPGTEYPGTDYPGTEYPGTDYPGTDYPGTDYPGTGEPGSGDETMYTVMYNGAEFITIPESELSDFETLLTEGTDYTISGTVITLTDSGYAKVMAAMPGAGEEGYIE